MNNPLVQLDPGLFIWTIVTFLVLLTLLAKFAWGPLLAGAREPAERDPEVAGRCAAGEAGARAAEPGVGADHPPGARRGRGDRHARAGPTPSGCGKRCGRRPGPRPTASSGTPSARFSSRPQRALQQIRHEAVDLSVMIASKIIQRNLTKEDNERLIDDALKQVETRRHWPPRRQARTRPAFVPHSRSIQLDQRRPKY